MSATLLTSNNPFASSTARSGKPDTTQPRRGFLVFRLGAEEYGVDILRAQEIRGYQEPTALAGAPAFVKGVVDLRGTIVPIVDLRMKFRLAEVPYDNFTVTIVLNIGDRVLGIVVDSVSDVVDLSPAQIKAAPAFGSQVEPGFIDGIAEAGQGDRRRMLILVDIEALMTSPEMGLFNSPTDLPH